MKQRTHTYLPDIAKTTLTSPYLLQNQTKSSTRSGQRDAPLAAAGPEVTNWRGARPEAAGEGG
jgi:hypothetical protein